MTQHTPGRLRVIMRGPDHDAIITEAGGIVANVNRQRRETTVSSNAAELVRRWNTHEVMLEALRAAHKHAHKALTAESNSYTDEENMLDVLAAAIAAAEGRTDLTSGA